MKHKTYLVRCAISILVFSYLFFGGTSVIIAQQATEQKITRRVATIAVTEIRGDARILSKAEAEKRKGEARILGAPVPEVWTPATPRTMLGPGDQLRTEEYSSMKLQLNDGTVITLSDDSLLVVETMQSARGQTPQTIQLKLEKGRVSTRQPPKILGQANQIIRTENGSVNTSLAEIEVWKPEQKPRQYVLLAALSPLLPQIAQAKNDATFVNLARGTAAVESSGKGKITTDSFSLPGTCPDKDGVRFTLAQLGAKVTITNLGDGKYRLTSSKPFHLEAGTQATVSRVNITNNFGKAELDVDGIETATLQTEASASLLMHPMMTAGIKGWDIEVDIQCDEEASKDIGYRVLSTTGDVSVGEGYIMGTGRPIPSRGGIVPGIPTATPTPAGRITPTPEPEEVAAPIEPEEEPPPGPQLPVTHTLNPYPQIITPFTVTPVFNGAACPAGTYRINVPFQFNNNLPTIQGGDLISILTDNTWNPQATFSYPIPDSHTPPPPYLYFDVYTYTWPTETGTLRYYFCYNLPFGWTNVYFRLTIYDSYGLPSNTVNCSGDVTAGPFNCP